MMHCPTSVPCVTRWSVRGDIKVEHYKVVVVYVQCVYLCKDDTFVCMCTKVREWIANVTPSSSHSHFVTLTSCTI